MLKPKTLLLLFVLLLSFTWLFSSALWKKARAFGVPGISLSKPHYVEPKSEVSRKAEEARGFIKEKGFFPGYCFLIDMHLPSGQNRFFVYDLAGDSVMQAGLVAHGNCNQFWLDGRKYGNEPGCGCTSLGKYKIGYAYTGRFGHSFKLYGLEKTNSNAFQRAVVLHSYSCVPPAEVPEEICQSNGCPMVSPAFMVYLEEKIQAAKKPVLLWIFE